MQKGGVTKGELFSSALFTRYKEQIKYTFVTVRQR